MNKPVFLLLICFSCTPLFAQGFKDLGMAEKFWVVCHPFSAKKAQRITKDVLEKTKETSRLYSWNQNQNGAFSDAFRHSYWMLRLSCEIGPKRALWLGKAHEKKNRRDFKKGRLEEVEIPDKVAIEMDLLNNEIATKKYQETRGCFESGLREVVLKWINKGELFIIKQDGLGNYLDKNNQVIPKLDWMGKWENQRQLVPSNFNL